MNCRKYGKLHYPKFSSMGRPMKDPQKQRIWEKTIRRCQTEGFGL